MYVTSGEGLTIMADRRMFSRTIIDSDAFLEMPLTAQALYFHLAMRADDAGFVGNPKRIRGMIGASEDDLKILILKRFILVFESGVVVIKHWWMHNYIQNDRYKGTTYLEEKNMLQLDEKKAYTEKLDTTCFQNGSRLYPNCIQTVSKLDPQVNIDIDKNRLDIDKISKDYSYYIYSPNSSQENKENSNEISNNDDEFNLDSQIEIIFKTWNDMEKTIHHSELNAIRIKAIQKALVNFKFPDILQAIQNYDLVLRSHWYFNYRWSLEDFLNRSNGISTFTNEGSNWISFEAEVKKNPLLLPRDQNTEKIEAPECFKEFVRNI